MCGICGFIDVTQRLSGEALGPAVTCMADTLAHRGPDDRGQWADTGVGVALGHRRLSILDLSPEGHQPMISGCGRYVIVFNGEIYNHHELRKELETSPMLDPDHAGGGVTREWRGHSDTEVMLAAIRCWGVEAAVKRFVGMFAFALWDREQRLLTLARDRMGEKPLYYGWLGDRTFAFASELKALRAHSAWCGEVDRNSLALFLRHNYVPTPYSIYKGIRKLPPGTILQLPLDALRNDSARAAAPSPYWTVRDNAVAGTRQPFTGSEAEAVQELDQLLRTAIRDQMIADVPLGAFLSGGIDSTTVVALMQAQSVRPVKTFTVGFAEAGYNEAIHAKAIAQHLGTDHTELYVSSQEAMAAIPSLPQLYDEPFSDSSQIPTYLICKLARSQVTVSLSGDGGDESFGGYNRYFWGRNIWRSTGWMPQALRSVLARLLLAPSPERWDRVFALVSSLLPARMLISTPGDKLQKLAEVIDVSDSEELYRRIVSHWKQPAEVVIGAAEPPTFLSDRASWTLLPDLTSRMMYADQMTYLPDDILVKVDRASMGVGLEARVPLLDHRIVEFAWRLPLSLKFRDGKGKWLLRRVLANYVPPALTERPKMGFGVPIGEWLRGPLRDWAEALLDAGRLDREGFFRTALIRQKWAEHLSGARNWQYHLWNILMFQAWLETQ